MTSSRARRVIVTLTVAASGSLVSGSAAADTILTVRAGDRVVTSAAGFAPHAAVEKRVDRTKAGNVRADARGRVVVRITAPQRPGLHRVRVIGAPPVPDGGVPAQSAARRTGPDRQTVVALVPRVVTIPIRVLPGSGIKGVVKGPRGPESPRGAGEGRGVDGVVAGRGSAPADTGVDMRLPLALGAGLVALGVALCLAVRRRRTG